MKNERLLIAERVITMNSLLFIIFVWVTLFLVVGVISGWWLGGMFERNICMETVGRLYGAKLNTTDLQTLMWIQLERDNSTLYNLDPSQSEIVLLNDDPKVVGINDKWDEVG